MLTLLSKTKTHEKGVYVHDTSKIDPRFHPIFYSNPDLHLYGTALVQYKKLSDFLPPTFLQKSMINPFGP